MALFPGLPGWAATRKVKPIWILLKQATVSGSGISWAICKSAPCSRQITMPAPHHSAFYRPDALPAAQPTASKHSRILCCHASSDNPVTASFLYLTYCSTYGWWCRCEDDSNGTPQLTGREHWASSYHVTQHGPVRSESLQAHTERSSRPGPELSFVEADVYIWHYALLVMHAGKEEEIPHIL